MRIALACLLMVSACATGTPFDPLAKAEFLQGVQSRRLIGESSVSSLSGSEVEALLRQELSNKTAILLQEGRGIYVEYTSANGELVLWYPGNNTVVRGSWHTKIGYASFACFRYYGASGSCVDAADIIGKADVLSQRDGDPFELMSGNVPFVKTKDSLPPWP